MMSKNKWLGAAVGVIALLATGAASAQQGELWHFYSSGSEAAGLEALVAKANEMNADNPITPRVFPGNIVEMRRQIQTSLMGGAPPAAYQSGMGYELKTFADEGHLRSLQDVWDEIKGDEIFPEGVQRVSKVDGVPMGIPYDLSLINNIFYNKAIFEANDITVPTDWDSLVAACEKLKAAGIPALNNAGGPFWTLYNFYPAIIETVGVDGYYNIASGKLGFDTPEFRKALDLFRDTYVSCYAENWSGKSWTQAADDVINGDVAMFQMGIWAAGYMENLGFKAGEGFDFFPAPGTANLSIFQMDLFAVPAGDEAVISPGVAFAKAASTAEAQGAFAVLKGSLTPNSTVDPSIFGYAGSKFTANLQASEAVLPNLFFLLPTSLGTELGAQLERFAIDPSDATLDSVVQTLEAQRTELLASNAFVEW
jgi:ABC-type glycerol-3-phosphate transport system substrate-binding protein